MILGHLGALNQFVFGFFYHKREREKDKKKNAPISWGTLLVLTMSFNSIPPAFRLDFRVVTPLIPATVTKSFFSHNQRSTAAFASFHSVPFSVLSWDTL
jgi:hypothetical protein